FPACVLPGATNRHWSAELLLSILYPVPYRALARASIRLRYSYPSSSLSTSALFNADTRQSERDGGETDSSSVSFGNQTSPRRREGSYAFALIFARFSVT